MDKTPIYKESFQYAYQHGEETRHIASHTASIGCAAAIVQAIADHYSDNRLNTAAAVRDVVKRFGYERTLYVLANTVQDMEGDGRVSRANKDWARAKTKDHDRLMAMLPFQSLTLSTLNGRKSTYALIRQDENRFRPLVLRRPSLRKQLQEQQPDAPKPSSPGRGKAKGPEL